MEAWPKNTFAMCYLYIIKECCISALLEAVGKNDEHIPTKMVVKDGDESHRFESVKNHTINKQNVCICMPYCRFFPITNSLCKSTRKFLPLQILPWTCTTKGIFPLQIPLPFCQVFF